MNPDVTANTQNSQIYSFLMQHFIYTPTQFHLLKPFFLTCWILTCLWLQQQVFCWTNGHLSRITQSPDRPCVFQQFDIPTLQDNQHMKVVWSSALRTGHLCPLVNIPSNHFCEGLSRPQGHSVSMIFK